MESELPVSKRLQSKSKAPLWWISFIRVDTWKSYPFMCRAEAFPSNALQLGDTLLFVRATTLHGAFWGFYLFLFLLWR